MAKVPNLKTRSPRFLFCRNLSAAEKSLFFENIMRQHNTVDNPVETVHNSDFARIFQVYSAVMFWRNGKHFLHFSFLYPKKTEKSEKMAVPLVIVVKKVYNIQNFVL